MAASLWQKLLSAFALVVLLGGVVQVVLVNNATQTRFDEFVSRSGQAYAAEVAPTLAAYYAANQGWDAAGLTGPGAPDASAPGNDGSSAGSASNSPATDGLPAQPSVAEQTPLPTPAVAATTTVTGADQGAAANTMGPMRGMHAASAQATPVTGTGADTGAGTAPAGSHAAMMGGQMMGAQMAGAQVLGANMWTHMGVRLVLEDAAGNVVADTGSVATPSAGSSQRAAPGVTASAIPGAALDASPGATFHATPGALSLAAGTPITVAGRTVGTLYVAQEVNESATLAREFLAGAQRSAWLASLAAGAVAMLLGLLLFREIVAPVRKLTAAAHALSAGQWQQRVPVTSRDEIGELAGAFNQMADALAVQQQLRRNLMADVAHELRTPLTVIQGNLEAMLDGLLPLEREEIETLHQETVLLTRLVGDLRLLSVAEAGTLALDRCPVAPAELLARAAEAVRRQAEEAQVTLSLSASPDLPDVLVDADRISQVLGNLLHNALRYTGPQGQVHVQASAGNDAHGRRTVVVMVADTGVGIAPDDLPYVFDRFYRGDKSRSRATGGSGIGLALARQLVEAHGGSIWVESKMGAGATFRFSLPTAT